MLREESGEGAVCQQDILQAVESAFVKVSLGRLNRERWARGTPTFRMSRGRQNPCILCTDRSCG